ncbi:adenylate/guanylate cyclase domain-containing protein [Altericista sp. CCNU0014]|uniref:adenylate/guanylate cyclase domain-containing protein n=1 Tax=Altericista sp. CCNU0014 TaxID=3082949 RepID=UPI00384C0114
MRSLNQLSIKSKLIAMLLGVSGVSILVTAYLGYQSGQANLTSRVFSQLTSLRASKAYQIESYFKNIHHHTETLSENPAVIAAMQEFAAAHRELESAKVPAAFDRKLASYYRQEFLKRLAKAEDGSPVLESYLPTAAASRYLQYQYIANNANPVGKKHLLDAAPDGSTYSRVHRRYHSIFRKIIQKFGYYDMFLIDPQGTVVYTVFKETDFTTNFGTGAYKTSNLARLAAQVQQAKEKDYSKIIDFEGYGPSYGAPAAFIAAPIFDRSKLIGVLAFQLPVDEINNVMTGNRKWEEDGLGKTGETYLVGRDYLMRSVSRFLEQDPKAYLKGLQTAGEQEDVIRRIGQYKTSILQQKEQTTGTAEALLGRQGTRILKDYRGVAVLSSYAPLKLEGLDWVILSEIDLSEAYEPIYSFTRQVLISATLLMLVLTIAAMIMAYLFVKPIQHLIDSARKVQDGEMDAIAPLNPQDEFGELAQSFNGMLDSLHVQTALVAEKTRENEQLLLSFFPTAIAKRLKQGEKDIAEEISNVAVMFTDLTGFSKLAAASTAPEMIHLLNEVFAAFDDAADRYGMEKIKTIGDSYMAICGLSVPYLDHDKRAIGFGLELQSILRRLNQERGFQLDIQVGIDSGDVIAGIIGRHRLIYDVWGETVNIASSLREACPAGEILVSEAVYERLKDLYDFEAWIDAEGSGKEKIQAWRLKSAQPSSSPKRRA